MTKPRWRWWIALTAALLVVGCSDADPPVTGDASPPDQTTKDAGTEAAPQDGPVADAPGSAELAQLIAFTQQEMAQRGVPGAALAVVINGKLAHVRGLGFKQQGGAEAVSPDSLFSLAAVSKTFTGALAMALVDKGKVKITDTVASMIPKLTFSDPAQGAKVTLHGLLAHTSGVGHVDSNTLFAPSGVNWSSPDSLVQAFEQITWPVWCPPGAVWNYNNMGHSMAGAALQKKLGQPFHQLLDEQIFTPAGMTRSTALGSEAAKLDHTKGHGGGAPIAISSAALLFDGPNNGVFSSAREMGRFAEVLLADGAGVLSKAAVATMSSAQADLSDQVTGQGYGYGLYRLPRDGVVVVSHSGTNRGWTADLALVPDKKFAVVVLMNASTGWPANVSHRALELFLKLPPYSKPAYSITPAELQALAGSYDDPFKFGKIQVTAAGSQLTASFTKWGHTALMGQWGKRSFSVATAGAMQQALGAQLVFSIVPDAAGKGKYLVSRLGVATATAP
jgi:CubicO group peptidase (beta-lactamase class C family)